MRPGQSCPAAPRRQSCAPIEALASLERLPAAWVWGLFSRGLGAVFLIAFVSLAIQVRPIAGRRGLAPIAQLLAAIRRDFPAPRRWLYFPTLLWIRAGDRALTAIPWLGALAALSIVIGGPHAPWGFFACWLLYLSLDLPMGLVYPWDSALLECGFWAMLLPATATLPDARALSAPAPEIAWVFRLLLFRILFGFGKQKFAGSTRSDVGFLHGFFVRQPLPTPLGWLAHRAPMGFHALALGIMFVIELILPFGLFLPAPASALFAIATSGLMVAIAATGNFGFFNLLTIALCLVCLDGETARAFSLARFFDVRSFGEGATRALVALHCLGALLCLPLNTWASFTWTLWAWWPRALPAWARWPISLFRALQPLRWLHPYGVFPPRSAPAVKTTPTLELTWDGETWHTPTPRFWPTLETSPPRFFAPYHPRFDQAIVYESVGFHEASGFRGLTGRWNPYGHARGSGAALLMRRVLEGELDGEFFFGGSLPRERGAPIAARMPLYLLTPTTPRARASTGRWWNRRLIGPHLPLARRGDAMLRIEPPPPELWHPEELTWQRRSRLGPLMRRAAAGDDVHALVLREAEGLSTSDVERFWSELVPWIGGLDRRDWGAMRAHVEAARARWGLDLLDRFERLAGRYALFLVARCEPDFVAGGLLAILGLRAAPLEVRSHWQLALLARHVICEGREAYDQVMASPREARAHAARMTTASGAFLDALFRFESLVHQSQKLRMLASQVDVEGWPAPSERKRRVGAWGLERARRLWGVFEMMEFLREQFRDEGERAGFPERWPRFRLQRDASLVEREEG